MVIAPYSPSYTNRVNYLTVAEFQAAPTGLDLSDLIPQGIQLNQSTAISELIGRASAIMDNYCFGTSGTLCATLNTDNTGATVTSSGKLFVHPKYWPVLAVTSASVGANPGSLSNVVLTSGNCWIEEQSFTLIAGWNSMTSQGPLAFGGTYGQEAYCVYSYVNGWPNTLLSASVPAGSSSASVTALTGIYPGTNLNIYDAPYDEAVVVSPTYVAGTNPVTFAAPLQYPHGAGISVSALPQSIKYACVLITAALVRERGGGSNIVLSEVGEGTSETTAKLFNRDGDLAWAAELLDPFRQVMIQY